MDKVEKVPITTEFIKLDSFLKLSGVSDTGGGAKLLVKEGKVMVDGEVCTMRGKKLRPGNRIEIEGIRGSFEVSGS